MENIVENKRGGQRESGIELFRITSMLVIVAHHYIVNSGVMDAVNEVNAVTGSSLFALLFGWGGKTGINCFVLITGYFMCTSRITLKKFLKLLLEIEFYKVTLFFIFVFTGYAPFSLKSFIKAVLPVQDISSGFTSTYLLFFLFIPFLNVLVQSMKQKQHLILIGLSVGVYSIWASLGFYVTFNYVTWFSVLYIIASYIREYPNKWFDNTKLWGFVTIVMLILSWLSVSVLAFIAPHIGKPLSWSYYFVNDSNKVLAIITALCAFMFFKNLHFYNKIINLISAATFGVFLIHANSDTMRQWLWHDALDNVGAFGTNMMVLHAVGSILAVYIVCTSIDILRIKFVEKPFFSWYDTKLLSQNDTK